MRPQRNPRKSKNAAQHTLGSAVRELRACRVISQEELGFRARLHRNYIGALERGEINPTFRTLRTLAEGLEVELSSLICLYEERREDRDEPDPQGHQDAVCRRRARCCVMTPAHRIPSKGSGHASACLHDAVRHTSHTPSRMSSDQAQRGVSPSLTVVGLFAGIGGIELGFGAAGHRTVLLCEVDEAANLVLDERFPEIARHDDVTTLKALPEADVIAAGFPCQDLSQAGRTAGIRGTRSGLVEHVFALLDRAEHEPTWVVLENVPFMLQLDRGGAMTYLTRELGRRGYTWAYRVVDARAMGLPQRRQRVLLVASRRLDPRPVLFAQDAAPVERPLESAGACGFYWTEGLTGLGWAVDAVPTLKGGSALGIPSPPGIWLRNTGRIVTPDIRDAERLQGFPVDWTDPAAPRRGARNGPRWRLVGNAVSVPVARWLGERLVTDDVWTGPSSLREGTGAWPRAAWGEGDRAFEVPVSTWPVRAAYEPLADFLEFEPRALSQRATAGFLSRTRRASLRFDADFIAAIESHLDAVSALAA